MRKVVIRHRASGRSHQFEVSESTPIGTLKLDAIRQLQISVTDQTEWALALDGRPLWDRHRLTERRLDRDPLELLLVRLRIPSKVDPEPLTQTPHGGGISETDKFSFVQGGILFVLILVGFGIGLILSRFV